MTEGSGGTGEGGPLLRWDRLLPYTAAADAASDRSPLSGLASSLLGPGADWGVPGCGPSGPEDWGPAGVVGVWAAGVVAASVVCGRSWAEEVRGLGGAGEEEEEESAGVAEPC